MYKKIVELPSTLVLFRCFWAIFVYSVIILMGACENSRQDCEVVDAQCNPFATALLYNPKYEIPEIDWIYTVNSTASRIQRMRSDGSQLQDIASVSSLNALVIEPIGGHLYWADAPAQFVYRINLDGSGYTQLINSGNPQGMVIDAGNNFLFVGDQTSDTITRYTLDGTNTGIVASGLNNPEGLGFDSTGLTLYWASSGDGSVKKLRVYETSTIETVVSGLSTPVSAGVEEVEKKLLIVENGGFFRHIRSDLDGTNQEVLHSGSLFPFRPEPYSSTLYWCNISTGELSRTDWVGNNRVLFTSITGVPFLLDILYR